MVESISFRILIILGPRIIRTHAYPFAIGFIHGPNLLLHNFTYLVWSYQFSCETSFSRSNLS
jgi:hypothetical protein